MWSFLSTPYTEPGLIEKFVAELGSDHPSLQPVGADPMILVPFFNNNAHRVRIRIGPGQKTILNWHATSKYTGKICRKLRAERGHGPVRRIQRARDAA